MTIKPFLINPGRAKNPPHPQSYGAHLPLLHSEAIGGARKTFKIGRITAAEEARYNAVKAAGANWYPGMFSAPADSAPMTKTKTAKSPRASKRRFSAAQLDAQEKFAAMARKRSTVARKARSKTVGTKTPRRIEEGNSMAKAKKRKTRRRPAALAAAGRPRQVARRSSKRAKLRTMVGRVVNPRRRRKNTHRYKNPSTAKGILSYAMEGAKDGLMVVVGRGVTKMVAQKIPIGQNTMVASAAVQIGVGLVLAMAVRKITKSDRHASMFLAGAYSNVIQSAVAPLPVVGPILGGLSSYPRMSAGMGDYARAGMGAYAKSVTPPSASAKVMYGNNVGLSQPWGYDDPNLADGIFS